MRKMLFMVFILLLFNANQSRAAFFEDNAYWPPNAGGWTNIKVCIIEGSSAGNGSLLLAITRLRQALAKSWENDSSLRFTYWRSCAGLPVVTAATPQKDRYVGIYLSPSTGFTPKAPHPWGPDSRGRYGPVSDSGGSLNGSYSVSLPTRGRTFNNPRCDEEVNNFTCLQEYGVHEIGHLLGYIHEVQRADRPRSSLKNRVPKLSIDTRIQGQYTFAPFVTEIIPPNTNWTRQTNKRTAFLSFDKASIMSYDTDYTDFEPEPDTTRFGSSRLSTKDAATNVFIYPEPQLGTEDIGVLAGEYDCGDNEKITIYMDAEDDDPGTKTKGWTGVSRTNGNVWLEMCRTDGSSFRKSRRTYSVLKLGSQCPDDSISSKLYLDNEDSGNTNFVSGNISPGWSDTGGTTLFICTFLEDKDSSFQFPTLGYSYGVFSMDLDETTGGRIWIDDEDEKNNNSFSSPHYGPIYQNHNTSMRTSKVH